MTRPWTTLFLVVRVRDVGTCLAFVGRLVAGIPAVLASRHRLGDVLAHAERYGLRTVPIVVVTGLVTGALLALQSHDYLQFFGLTHLMGKMTAIALVRELGPAFTAIMVAALGVSASTSELAAMRQGGQIQAMWTLRRNPYLVLGSSRLVAALVALPLATLVGTGGGFLGAILITMTMAGQSPRLFLHSFREGLTLWDVVPGLLVKPPIFGFFIASVSCYRGFHATGGSQGVGVATTRAMVTTLLLIIIANLAVSQVVLWVRPARL